jgi:divalent metal cation (Fe/Co/Zn/Cd) transporter
VLAFKTHAHGSVWPNYVILRAALGFDGTSLGIAAEAHGLIVGEAARGALVSDARRIIEETDAVGGIERLRTLQLGPEAVLLVLGARWRDGIPVHEMARVSRELESRLRAEHPSIRHVVFDFGDAKPKGPE